MNTNCRECGIKLKNPHFNQKKCIKCKEYLKKYPKSTMTKEQISYAKSQIGIRTRAEICKDLNISLISLKRAFRGIRFPHLSEYDKETVNKVCSYYEKNGKKKTQEKFPEVRVRSIVEKYKVFKPRCKKWTDDQFKDLAQMAGLISLDNQAKYFNRPRAHKGSIRSVWVKRFGHGQRGLHGMSKHHAKYFIKQSCPATEINFNNSGHNIIYLWSDMENYLKEDCPLFIKEAIQAMAEFQRWIYQNNNPQNIIKNKIKKVLKKVKGEKHEQI